MTTIPMDQLNQIRGLLEQAKSVAIIASPQPSIDAVAASLALYLALSATGKTVSVISTAPMTVEFSHLVGVDKIVNTIGTGDGRNMVISFPYQEGSIEKVSYNIEQETFNLVIEPRVMNIIVGQYMKLIRGGEIPSKHVLNFGVLVKNI